MIESQGVAGSQLKKKKKSRDITLANMKTAPAKFSEFPFKEAYSFIILVFDDI